MNKEEKRLYDIEYRKKNKEKLKEQKKEWAKLNKDKISISRKKHKQNKKITDKIYAINNKEKINEKKKAWALNNKEKVKKAKYDYVKKKMSEDPLYKLKHHIICSVIQSFKRNNYTKKSRTFNILGCTYEFFKKHIESQWESWMTWDNYGNKNGISKTKNKSWDIDHIIPLSSAKTEEDVIRLNHYTNLQPLCSYTNRWVKSNRF